MLTIRFIRIGKKNQPFFRLVVCDKKNPPRGGRFLEILGHFNPLSKAKSIKKERAEYWLSVGAKPSPRVYNLLIEEGIVKGKKIAVHAKPKKEEAKKEELKPKETAMPETPKEEGPVNP